MADDLPNESEPPKNWRKGATKGMSQDHNRDWLRIRAEWETNGLPMREFAKAIGIPYGTLSKRSMRDGGWKKRSALVHVSARRLDAAISTETEKAIERQVTIQAETVAQSLLADLQPWIEQKKAEHIKRSVERGERHLQRIDNLTTDESGNDIVHAPKDELSIARAVDSHDNIIRRNLGMADSGNGQSGSLNVHILAGGRAAISIRPASSNQVDQVNVDQVVNQG